MVRFRRAMHRSVPGCKTSPVPHPGFHHADETTSVERVAAEVRDRWKAIRVLTATPDVMRPDLEAYRMVFDAHDRWLLAACRLEGIEVPVEVGARTLLSDERRLDLRRRLTEAGWEL